MEVSGGQNSTHTTYYATFELPGGVRREFELDGSEYGQLAEDDTGQLTYQGTRYLGFQRSPAAEPGPEVPVNSSAANLVCDYCGSAIPAGSIKCAGCGWTWRPSTKSPVSS